MSCPQFDARSHAAERLTLDEVVEAFEAAWEIAGEADPRSYIPAPEHPEWRRIALELLCVDAERRSSAGRRRSLVDYRREFADVLSDVGTLERLAFEDYRVRLAHGELVDPDEYALALQLDTRNWPRLTAAGTKSCWRDETSRWSESTNRGNSDIATDASQYFPEFQVEELLGIGAFSRVYLARQPSLANREVVIKITRSMWSDSDRLARLQHTNIVPVYSVHRAGNLQAVCMPLLGRYTLAQLIAGSNQGTEPSFDHFFGVTSRREHEEQCLGLTMQLASGLQHAHERGILHRDVKPANILVTDDHQPLLLDFNLSADTNRRDAISEWMGGTVPYMSPEQLQAAASDGKIDARADIYSLGVVLFEMLTGKVPFKSIANPSSDDVEAMLSDRRHSKKQLTDLARFHSPGAIAILRRCLEPDVDRRYQKACELHEDLRRQCLHLPLCHVRERSLLEPVRKWTRRHPRWKTISAAVGIVSLALVSLLVTVTWSRARIHRMTAQSMVQTFEQQRMTARASLSIPWHDTAAWQDAIDSGHRAMLPFKQGVNDWRHAASLNWLDAATEERVRGELDELERLLVRASHRQASNESLPSIADDRRHDDTRQNRPTPWIEIVDRVSESQYDTGLRLLIPWCTEKHDDYTAHLLRGICLEALNQSAAAEASFTACVTLWPEGYLAYFNRGVARQTQHRYEEAEQDFTAVIRLRPDIGAAYLNRGLTRLASDRAELARDDFSAAMKHGRNDALSYLLRSRAYRQLGADDLAQGDREEGLHREAADEEGWIQRGLARLAEDPAAAAVDFRRALQRNPQNAKAMKNLAHVLADRLQQPRDALKVLDRLVQLNATNGSALASRALIYARLGQRVKAIEDIQLALQYDQTAITYYMAACCWAITSQQNTADVEPALNCLQLALQGDLGLAANAASDGDLSPLVTHPTFQELLAAAGTLRSPPLGSRP